MTNEKFEKANELSKKITITETCVKELKHNLSSSDPVIILQVGGYKVGMKEIFPEIGNIALVLWEKRLKELKEEFDEL